jgi:hypothetical protein
MNNSEQSLVVSDDEHTLQRLSEQDKTSRRVALIRMGKYSAYAIPALLALSNKAIAGS